MTQIFRLDHESANNLVPVLRPLISPNNTINVNPGSNALVITDYADNLRRLGRIIAAMDMPNATDVEVIALKHALASDLAPLVLRLTQPTAGAAVQGQVDNSFRTAIIAEPRSNALIVRAANPARVALVRSLVERLDQPIVGRRGRQHPCGLSEERRGGEAGGDLRAAMAGSGHGGQSAGARPVSPALAARPLQRQPLRGRVVAIAGDDRRPDPGRCRRPIRWSSRRPSRSTGRCARSSTSSMRAAHRCLSSR